MNYESKADVIRIQFIPADFPQLLCCSAKLLCCELREGTKLCWAGLLQGPQEVNEDFVLLLAKPTAYSVSPTVPYL